MHRFTFRDGSLWCEKVRVETVARTYGTPLYLYSYGTLLDHFKKLARAFSSVRPLICFSVKSNGNLAVLRSLVRQGAGLDIVSGGELQMALKAGCPPRRIVYASVGKSYAEIRKALAAGVFCFNVESEAELAAIAQTAKRMGKVAPVALRINPNVAAHTHRYITTGRLENKFGIPIPKAEELMLKRWSPYRGALRLMGLHLHIGSQITTSTPFVQAIRRVGPMLRRLRAAGVNPQWLNLGGGLGIVYKDERPQTAQTFARAILPHLKTLKIKLILEPGRFIVGNAGILVTQVLYLKQSGKKRFAIVDAGMNDLLRPSLYGAHHEIASVTQPKGARGRKQLRYDVVGPVCESGDFLAQNRLLPELKAGDRLALFGAGAYGFSMASNYNARPKPPEILVRGKNSYRVRRRQTIQDLTRGETVPRFLK